MEDGAVLGSLFSRLQTRDTDEIFRLLNAYQSIRQDRCKVTLESEAEKVAFSVLEDGDPTREARDAEFRAARNKQRLVWEDMGDDIDYLQKAWEELRFSFGYEAYDAADDWWIDWGVMRERLSVIMDDSEAKPIPGAFMPISGLTIVVNSSLDYA